MKQLEDARIATVRRYWAGAECCLLGNLFNNFTIS